jgi:hypothetical protein
MSLVIMVSTLYLQAQPQLQPLSLYPQAALWEEPLSTQQLMELSFYASGVEEQQIPLYIQKMEEQLLLFSQYMDEQPSDLDLYDQAELLLQWLHEHILTRYIEIQTRMDVLLDQGSYNCVSSAVLYMIFASQLDLQVQGVETQDHAFCVLTLPQGNVDIETTTPYGIDPGSRKEFTDAFSHTGYNYVPPGNYRDRTINNQKQMISLILQNRMASLQRHNDHEPVVNLAVNRWVLYPDSKALADLHSAFGNWAAWLNGRQRYQEAFDFILQVSREFDLLSDNQNRLYQLAHNRLAQELQDSDLQAARFFLDSTNGVLLPQDQQSLEDLYFQEDLKRSMESSSYSQALELLHQAWQNQRITQPIYTRWLYYLHQNQAVLLSQQEGWYQAWQFLTNLPEEEASLPLLKNTARQMQDNWAAEQHNSFAQAFQHEDYSTARTILEAALLLDPLNTMLLRDLRQMDHGGF